MPVEIMQVTIGVTFLGILAFVGDILIRPAN
jgi:hypothetical protein